MKALPTKTRNLIVSDPYLITQAIMSGEAIASDLRAAILRESIRGAEHFEQVYDIDQRIRELAISVQPMLAESFWQADVSAWLQSYDWNAKQMPPWLRTHLMESGIQTPNRGTFGILGDDKPDIVFPKIVQAAKSLMSKNVMDRAQFDEMNDEAKARAFTVAGDLSNDGIKEVRDTLSELISTGPSLEQFTERIEERLGKGKLGTAHLETIYRTNVQAAYRDGRESLVQNPIVSAVFPYQEMLPIDDGRVRFTHLELGKLGLNGTGIYRRDDPFWNYFTPPWDYSCRCGVNLLTLEKAASKGVREAQEWIKNGYPPENPEYRFAAIPFLPTPGFGQRHGRVAA